MESFARTTHRFRFILPIGVVDEQIFPHVGRLTMAAAGLTATVRPAHHCTLTKAGIRNRRTAPHGEQCLHFPLRPPIHIYIFPHACTRNSSQISKNQKKKTESHRPEVKNAQTLAPSLSKVPHSSNSLPSLLFALSCFHASVQHFADCGLAQLLSLCTSPLLAVTYHFGV